LPLIFVVCTSESDCLEDRLRNDLTRCVEWDAEPHSLTHSLISLIWLDSKEKRCMKPQRRSTWLHSTRTQQQISSLRSLL